MEPLHQDSSDTRSTAQQVEGDLQSKGVREAKATEALAATEASILREEGKRDINRMWEKTQMRISLTVIGGGFALQFLVVGSVIFNLLVNGKIEAEMLTLLVTVLGTISSTQSLIIGFYFYRTNHQKTGGVGKDEEGR